MGFFVWEDMCERSNVLFVCALVSSSFRLFCLFVCGLPKNFPLEHVGPWVL